MFPILSRIGQWLNVALPADGIASQLGLQPAVAQEQGATLGC